MLNIDLKIISKALHNKPKIVLLDLISSQPPPNGKNRHISESERLLSDITEIAKTKNRRFFHYDGH